MVVASSMSHAEICALVTYSPLPSPQAGYSGHGQQFMTLLDRGSVLLARGSRTAPARELATVLWGQARLLPGSPAPPPGVASTIASRLREFNGQDIVFVTYACARLRHQGKPRDQCIVLPSCLQVTYHLCH